MSPKYAEQFDRVNRLYVRFERLNSGMDLDRFTEDGVDDIYSFFQNCYHLKDWLRDDPKYTTHSNSEIEAHVTNNAHLCICADVCNGLKHLTLRTLRSGAEPKFGKKTIAVNIGAPGANAHITIGVKIEIVHNGKSYDAFDVATGALKAWTDFI